MEPDIEIKEYEHSFRSTHDDDCIKIEDQSSDSNEENNFQQIQEYESVLENKICAICGNPFQAFELIDAKESKKPRLTTCEKCSYYIPPHIMEVEDDKLDMSSTNRRHQCDKCSKSFARKDGLERHKITHSDLRPFKCKMCQKCFKRNDKLTEHVATHAPIRTDRENSGIGTNENKYTVGNSYKHQCDVCAKSFAKKNGLERHKVIHSDLRPFKCKMCEKCFKRNDKLTEHVETTHVQIGTDKFTENSEIESNENISNGDNTNRYQCDKCTKSFARKDGLERHKFSHSDLRPFKCKICQKCFKRNDKLTEHVEATHAQFGTNKLRENSGHIGTDQNICNVMCDICGDLGEAITVIVDNKALNFCEVCNLSRKEGMNDSKNKDSKLFQCDLCLRNFSRKDHAVRHRFSHLDVKPFECLLCQKSFSRNDRLLRHMKTHPNVKPFSCRTCFEAFNDRNELKTHEATHPNSKHTQHKCSMCQKEFRDKARLERHLTVHLDYKPYICDCCGKDFKLKEALISHLQIHQNWRPFKCKTCGLDFKIKETLKRHLLVHTNVSKYTCQICSKTFKRRDKLKVHSLIHQDVKPFVCSICKKAFKRKDKLTRHCKNVHGFIDTVFTNLCDVCGKTFDCEDDLTEHKMVHYR